jgi:hypothetical protein
LNPAHSILRPRDRAELIALCAAQRADLAAVVHGLEGPIKIVDKGVSFAKYLQQRPLALAAMAALLTATRGRGVWKWAQRGFVAWRTYRALAR